MAPHLGLQRIMIPGSQVSALTTGTVTLPGARGAFVETRRALFAGGNTSHTTQNVIDYIDINTLGNAVDFGDTTEADNYSSNNASSDTRALFYQSSTTPSLEYVTIATTGNATSYGSLSVNRYAAPAGFSSSTRGLYGGGIVISGDVTSNIIDYGTIATTGNFVDFGDLTQARYSHAGCASTTRGILAGGNFNQSGSGASNVIDYVTMASVGNATDFGELTSSRDGTGGASNSIRGVFMAGNLPSTNITSTIDFVTIATTGNATGFGNMSSNRRYVTAVASPLRVVMTSGLTTQGGTYSFTATMEYVTIATEGSSATFGDLTVGRWSCGGASGSHGGI